MSHVAHLWDLIDRINPVVFVKYLEETGWRIFPRKRTDIRVFQTWTLIGGFYQVIVPLDKKLSDYENAMYEAIKTTAYVERRSIESLLLFLSTES